MQLSKKLSISMALLACLAIVTGPAIADSASKTKAAAYTEDQFIHAFSGKSRKVIEDKLGAPAKKEQGVRPASAEGAVSQLGQPASAASKPVNVEMWYYKNLVNYDPKRKYKETELTFVNDRCMNIAFFNNR